jgi:hypothetical protein
MVRMDSRRLLLLSESLQLGLNSWSPDARYARSTQQQAEELLQAISDEDDGVLVWIKAFG